MEEENEWGSRAAVIVDRSVDFPRMGNGNEQETLGRFYPKGFVGEGKMMKKLFDMPHGTMLDTSASYQLGMKFIAETEGDVAFGRTDVVFSEENHTLWEVVSKIKECLTDARAVSPFDERAVIMTGEYNGDKALIWINTNSGSRRRAANKDVMDLKIDILSAPASVEGIKAFIEESFKDEKLAMIKWWTSGAHGDNTREFYLPQNKTRILPEFYPDLADPVQYLADYMAADESILMLAGPPGTGKTTLLRHLVTDYRLSAHVIYDELLMQKDAIFQSFLFDDHGDIMIIEDADQILGSREREGNKLMSRFLNVADGLIKLPNKKLVFTTNIADFGQVDSALLRPGRCYGVIHTRTMNLAEAQAAARVANLPIPTEKREWTIAELFNQGSRPQVRTIGFGARH